MTGVLQTRGQVTGLALAPRHPAAARDDFGPDFSKHLETSFMNEQQQSTFKTTARIAAAVLATLVIMLVVPAPVYGAFTVAGASVLPDQNVNPHILASILVIKIGFALAFVLLFRLCAPALDGRWGSYTSIWWLMFALLEMGKAIGPGYSAMEALAGVVSEAFYLPLSAVAVAWILARR